MKTISLFLLATVCSLADSRTEKALREQLKASEASVRGLTQSITESHAEFDKREKELLRDASKRDAQIKELTTRVESLTGERDALRARLHEETAISTFQSKVISAKSLTGTPVIPAQAVEVIAKVAPKIESKIDRNHKESKETMERILDATETIEKETAQLNAAAARIAAVQVANSERSRKSAYWQAQAAKIVNWLFWIGMSIGLLFLLIVVSMIMVFTHADRKPGDTAKPGTLGEPNDFRLAR